MTSYFGIPGSEHVNILLSIIISVNVNMIPKMCWYVNVQSLSFTKNFALS